MNESNLVSQTTLSGFQFSAVPIDDNLTDTEYLIGEIAIDLSGSMSGFERDLENMLKEVTTMNKKLPTANRIMQRVTGFHSNVFEIHGTRLVTNIDPDEYNGTLRTGGLTALNDAAVSCLEAAEKYCRDLIQQDYDASTVIFVLTDGGENDSKRARTVQKVADAITRIKRDEEAMTFLTTCLIGFNDHCAKEFEQWSKDAGFDVFLNMKDVTPSSLGKACNLISQSFSSASQQVTSKDASAVINQMTI